MISYPSETTCDNTFDVHFRDEGRFKHVLITKRSQLIKCPRRRVLSLLAYVTIWFVMASSSGSTITVHVKYDHDVLGIVTNDTMTFAAFGGMVVRAFSLSPPTRLVFKYKDKAYRGETTLRSAGVKHHSQLKAIEILPFD